MSKGWVKIHRSLLNNAAWRDCTPVQNRILITLMLNTAYKAQKRIIGGNVIELKEGQLVTTLNKLVELCGSGEVTISKVRTALKIFEAAGIISVEAKECYTLITVNTDDDTEFDTVSDTVYGTEEERAYPAETAVLEGAKGDVLNTEIAKENQGDNTVGSQEYHKGDKPIALIKEINNINNKKKDKNIIMCESAHTRNAPTLDEVRLFVKENGINADAERFFYHYESVGWKIGKTPVADWRAALRKWSVNGLDIRNTARTDTKNRSTAPKNCGFEQRTYTEEELERIFGV
ncbi:MAG: hypothetical protein IJR45_01295 [Firmicutes bacterium]|nr:hypothetical protein [Bacillota bacterium]